MKYVIFDHLEKSFMYDTATGTPEKRYEDMAILTFENEEEAENHKDKFLDMGNYENHPHSILEIMPYNS